MKDEKPWKITWEEPGRADVEDRDSGEWVGWVRGCYGSWSALTREGCWSGDRPTRAEAAALVYQAWIEAPHE